MRGGIEDVEEERLRCWPPAETPVVARRLPIWLRERHAAQVVQLRQQQAAQAVVREQRQEQAQILRTLADQVLQVPLVLRQVGVIEAEANFPMSAPHQSDSAAVR